MDKPENHMGFLLGRVSRLHHMRVHAVTSEIGLYPGQAPVMFELWRDDGLMQRDLSERVHLSQATLTATLDRLVKAGFIERRGDPDDQRISRVYLTEVGKKLKERVDESFSMVEAETFAGFTLEEKVLMRRFLLHMIDNLKTLASEGLEDLKDERHHRIHKTLLEGGRRRSRPDDAGGGHGSPAAHAHGRHNR